MTANELEQVTFSDLVKGYEASPLRQLPKDVQRLLCEEWIRMSADALRRVLPLYVKHDGSEADVTDALDVIEGALEGRQFRHGLQEAIYDAWSGPTMVATYTGRLLTTSRKIRIDIASAVLTALLATETCFIAATDGGRINATKEVLYEAFRTLQHVRSAEHDSAPNRGWFELVLVDERRFVNQFRRAYGPGYEFPAEWKTPDAVALARVIDADRTFSAMPILADALQDAGCTDEYLLADLRADNGSWTRADWVVRNLVGV